MNVNEAVAMQTPEMAQAGDAERAAMPPGGDITYQRADGTVERATSREDAIARCPVLGKLPVEEAEILLELAAEGSEQLAKDAEDEDERTRTTAETEEDNESAADFLKENKDKATGEEVESMEPELSAEADMEQFDREDAAAQEEIQKRQRSLGNKLNARRKRGDLKKDSGHEVDTDSVVRIVIAANPQVCKDFREAESDVDSAEALNALVSEAKKLSKAA